MTLFRREAMEARSKAGIGEVIIIQPRIFMIMTTVAVAMTIIAGLLAVFGQFSRKETVIGYLAPQDGIAALYAQRGGVVSDVLVAEGDRVEAGQVLMRLTTDAAAADGEAALEVQIRQIGFGWRRRACSCRSPSAGSTPSRPGSPIASRRLTRNSRSCARGWTWRGTAKPSPVPSGSDGGPWASAAWLSVEVDARRQAWISAQASAADITRLLGEREAERRDAEHGLSLLPSERDLELSRLRGQLRALEQNRAELRRAAGYALTAPVSGRITALQAVEGAAAPPSQPLAAILPDGSTLRAHLLAPTRASGFVTPGQEVRLRVDAFPYQRFGAVPGRIIDMSATVIAPNELAAPVMVQEPVYRLTVELETQAITAYGAAQPLQAGMALQADILVDRRPLWRWFIDPVMAARGG